MDRDCVGPDREHFIDASRLLHNPAVRGARANGSRRVAGMVQRGSTKTATPPRQGFEPRIPRTSRQASQVTYQPSRIEPEF